MAAGIVHKPVYVLGTGLSHDGSACLLEDGRIRVAIEKERITRVKHDGFNDTEAIRYCLEAEGLRLEDLDLIVQNANFGAFEYGNDWFRGPRLLTDGCPVPVVTISHHLAHAYHSVGTSPHEEMAVLVVDGCGSAMDECMDLGSGTVLPARPPEDLVHLWFEKDSLYHFRDGRVVPVLKDFSPAGLYYKAYPMHPGTTQHSIGGVYGAVSEYVFGDLMDAGKLMGLAPYGRPGFFTEEIFDLRDDGRVFVRYDWMKRYRRPARSREDFAADFQYYADIAYGTQREIERALLWLVEQRHRLLPVPCLAFTGGVALNAVANALLRDRSAYDELYLSPAPGDNGLAIGCAYYGWMETLGRPRVLHGGNTFFGRPYGEDEVGAALRAVADEPGFAGMEVWRADDPAAAAADLLAAGLVLGWFQEGSEFGPRALGHRSILADPRRPGVRDFINARVKFREDFRPFAPSVLLEDVSTYFDFAGESPYMILVAPVRDAWRTPLASVVHQDGSSRIQTVTPDWNRRYHGLLQAFRARTGLGVVLNTSFNRRGMPIVETPQEALRFFLECELDALVLESYVLRKPGR